MAATRDWAFSPDMQPKAADLGYDLDTALDAMVLLRAEVPEDAFTAEVLGTERAGYGVVIRPDGLVLTIGYLITEASAIWLTTQRGQVVPGHPLGYDQATGFGLVQPLGKLDATPLKRGASSTCAPGDEVVLAGHGGRAHALATRISDKREFAGAWEYVLDEAIFTSPAHPQWGGTALIDEHGLLCGIGSLLVQEQSGKQTVQGNMVVPIDLLEPILEDMVKFGRARRPPRAWLGLYAAESGGQLVVTGVAAGGPAERDRVQTGDLIIEVAGERVRGQADFFRKVWRLGPAGVQVPLTVARSGDVLRLSVRSGDRQDFLKKPYLH
jgi:S1-C subfamily serine protease